MAEAEGLMRVAVVFAILGPYLVARAKALAQIEGIEPTFVRLAESKSRYPWETDLSGISESVVTLSEGDYESTPTRVLSQRLAETLDHLDPQAVAVSGYNEPPMRAAARWAKANGRASILMFETTRWDQRRWWWKELPKRWFVRRYFDSGFAGGSSHRDYLVELGIQEGRIWERYDVVDNHYFASHAKQVRLAQEDERGRLELPDKYFLYAGRFSPEKNLTRLLEAYRVYREAQPDGWGLVLLGDGPQREELQGIAREAAIAHVRWPGFRQADELPSYYGLSGGFILPSTKEPWGLVVNEAMASGLPVLVSDRCGCAADLVEQGGNGRTFDPHDVGEMADRMSWLASLGEAERDALGHRSEEVIAGYTPEVWGESLADCARRTFAELRGGRPDALKGPAVGTHD